MNAVARITVIALLWANILPVSYATDISLQVRDMENSYVTLKARDSSAMDDLIGHSVTYRIAVGPYQGRKAFTLQTIPAHTQERDDGGLAKAAGFSLHYGVVAGAHQRAKLKRLCRYIARPAITNERPSLTGQGSVRYWPKTDTISVTHQALSVLLGHADRSG